MTQLQIMKKACTEAKIPFRIVQFLNGNNEIQYVLEFLSTLDTWGDPIATLYFNEQGKYLTDKEI